MFAEAEIARKESMSTPSSPLNMPVVEHRGSVSQQGPPVGVVFRKINKSKLKFVIQTFLSMCIVNFNGSTDYVNN
jgi:hypothetical protein